MPRHTRSDFAGDATFAAYNAHQDPAPSAYAAPARIADDTLDAYAARGVVLARDAASLVIAALRRDADEMRARGGAPNLAGADANDALAHRIGRVLVTS